MFLLGLVRILSHFVFTYPRSMVLGGMSRVGIVVLMLTFGSMFGFAVPGRIALLIDHVADLGSYSSPVHSLGAAGSAGSEASLLDLRISPPFLVGMLMILLLVVSATGQRNRAMRASELG